jgi:hypothetical protein
MCKIKAYETVFLGHCWGKEIFGNQSILYLHFILNSWKKVDLNEFDGLFFC